MPAFLSDRLHRTTEARFEQDWQRQRRTAADILQRLETQEGVILADQVGMGKTYVALAVAVSQIRSTSPKGQVVIFVPAAVADKWVREWKKFSESLLEHGHGIRCVDQPIRSGEEFLKRLDDAPAQRRHIVVVTHTALTATLKDSFVQLALLHHATRYVRNGADLRQRIAKWSTGMTGLIRNAGFTSERVTQLLDTPTSKWRDTWSRLGGPELADDPVPQALEDAVRTLSLDDLRGALGVLLPSNHSGKIEERLKSARGALVKATQATWQALLSSIKLDLPLLIVDEAHRLKNPKTDIGRLFAKRADDSVDGTFDGLFRRMLFLTATPFELGHSELVQVLTRMGAVRDLRPRPTVPLSDRLRSLKDVMTAAQVSALSLDEAWGRLSLADLVTFDNWCAELPPPIDITPVAREAWVHAALAARARTKMHVELQPWVIRHERPRRRAYHPGATIGDAHATGGLQIPDDVALPFLLAARAQSIALDEKHGRPLFAYGIASSYEAFMRLGSGDKADGIDSDLPAEDRDSSNTDALAGVMHCLDADAVGWYPREINSALSDRAVRERHPKIQATVAKAVQLWCAGEKCLVFCWFIRTGEAVESAVTRRIEELTFEWASKALGITDEGQTKAELDRICDRLFRRDSASYERLHRRLVDELGESANHLMDVVELVAEAALSHFRVAGSSYLLRFTHLSNDMDDETVWAGIKGVNPSGVVLLDRWRLFAQRLARARQQIHVVDPLQDHDSEFTRIYDALLGATTEGDGRAGNRKPVRRAHGGTKRDVRERLIAQFNTPLSPDILVASSVMGEGIDLHQECRFIIHHDLDWNPSVLEQRTGRLDRIGALAERQGRDIEVYEPYLAGTHDEKMFRVVKDRAQWFDIVMGRATGADENVTDAEETRVSLHERIRSALAMDLRSPDAPA